MIAVPEALSRVSVLGVPIAVVDYASAVGWILDWAERRESRAVSAMAVHGVMTGVLDRAHGARLRRFDMLTPDGQPVRWAVNLLSGAGLRDRVYGPMLTLHVCAAAAARGTPVYFYGSKREVVERMAVNLVARYPSLKVAGVQPSRFREATPEEDARDVACINASGAGVVFVGLGCPRQERWAFAHLGRISAVMVCVGAAFDFHAGTVPQAPPALQRLGLEWLYRFALEPRRLWQRYLLLNPLYVALLVAQWLGVWRPDDRTVAAVPEGPSRVIS